MRSTFGNAIDIFQGSLQINNASGLTGPLTVTAPATINAAAEFAANANVVGTSSLFVGQSGAGLSQLLARGAQQLNVGNANGSHNTLSTGALQITDPVGSVWGSPTGGAKGASSINVAGGLFVNGASLNSTQVVTLGVASTRTSTTTLAIDATLQVTTPSAGTYKVELFTQGMGGMTAGLGGIQAMIGLNANNETGNPYAWAQLAAPDTSAPSLGAAYQGSSISHLITVSNTAFFSGAAWSSAPGLYISGVVVLSASTTIGLYWAQAASSGTATNIPAGSTLVVTKIA